MNSEGRQSSYSLDRSLPTELICCILGFLSCNELVFCRQLCNSLKHIVDTTAALQYTLHLYLAGMADNPNHPLSTADKLALLKRYYDQWYSLRDHLQCVALFDVAYFPGHGITQHIIRGTLGIGPSLDSEFKFAQLPSRIREIPFKSWILQLPGYIDLFTFDPEQDVLIILKAASAPEERPSLRVLELSTGKRHPLASYPSLPLPDELDDPEIQIDRMRINGVYLAAGSAVSGFFAVWNWRSAQCICMKGKFNSFVWVGPTSVLLSATGSGINEPGLSPPALLLIDFAHSEGPHQWAFQLPLVLAKRRHPLAGAFLPNIYGELPPFRSPAGRSASDPPFHTADGDGLLLLTGSHDKFRMFFLARRLFDVAREMPVPPVPPNSHPLPVVIPWKLWGPGYTHVDDGMFNDPYLLYGTRYVAYRSTTSELVVQDFNPQRAKHKMQECGGTGENGTTTVRPFSDSYWMTISRESSAMAEERADLALNSADVDGRQKPAFVETIVPYDLLVSRWPPRFSEDAISVSRIYSTMPEHEDGDEEDGEDEEEVLLCQLEALTL
ncbi:hypothetical protein BDW22DRAFT_717000 [Trametopsis cervina]|nr:hypothetical protein BDW22DRAFT_717000 [Trametopsis cervina]